MISAVEWLEEQFNNPNIPNSQILFNQAKEIEKQQIINAYLKAKGKTTIDKALFFWDKSEEYYNKTYKRNANSTTK
jgi:hypothetical protein